jgi:hypothetical protein
VEKQSAEIGGKDGRPIELITSDMTEKQALKLYMQSLGRH